MRCPIPDRRALNRIVRERLGTNATAHQRQGPHAGPALTLLNAQGKQVRLSDYRGKVVLLDFWATDCGGCRSEIPEYIQMQAAYKKKGLAVVGVSMDIMYESLKSAKEAWDRVNPFAARQKINYPIIMGDNRTMKTYGFNAPPPPT